MAKCFQKKRIFDMIIELETLENGEVMASLKDQDWGPVVTGKTNKEALDKFYECMNIITVVEDIKAINKLSEEINKIIC